MMKPINGHSLVIAKLKEIMITVFIKCINEVLKCMHAIPLPTL